ncbi:MAG: DUF5320 domain-containing protein [Candidatus Bathyarchaeia archaeon]
MPNGWRINRWWRWRDLTTPGYYYLGPCRCGFGPHAYYKTADGRILHASQIPFTALQAATLPPRLEPEEEIRLLKEEAKNLQDELRRIEERLKELKGDRKEQSQL